MKTLALILAVSVAPVFAGPISQGERDFALSSLHSSRKLFLDSIAGLTPAQWNFKPAPDRWSIAEIADHVVLTEDAMRKWEQTNMAKPAGTPKPDARKRDQEIYQQAKDRTEGHREKAPKSLLPGGQFKTPDAAANAFRTKRDATLDYVRTTQDDLRSHFGNGESPIDVYQLLLTTAAHTERHVEQINDVKSDPRYPR